MKLKKLSFKNFKSYSNIMTEFEINDNSSLNLIVGENGTGKRVVLSPEAESWILEKVKKEDNGARPVIRTIQQNIEEPISDMVINEDPTLNNGSDILTAYLENDKLILR